MPAAKPAKKKTPATRAKAEKPDLATVFAELREMLKRFTGKDLAVQTDKPGNYHLEDPSILHRKKPLYFAGVRTGKNYVAFTCCISISILRRSKPSLRRSRSACRA